jgi:hypothetical protein
MAQHAVSVLFQCAQMACHLCRPGTTSTAVHLQQPSNGMLLICTITSAGTVLQGVALIKPGKTFRHRIGAVFREGSSAKLQ